MIDCGWVALGIGDMRHAAKDGCGMGANFMNSVAPQCPHFRDQSSYSAAQGHRLRDDVEGFGRAFK